VSQMLSTAIFSMTLALGGLSLAGVSAYAAQNDQSLSNAMGQLKALGFDSPDDFCFIGGCVMHAYLDPIPEIQSGQISATELCIHAMHEWKQQKAAAGHTGNGSKR